MSADPSTAELFRRALDARLADVHVSMPGVVEDYDPIKKTCSVQPALGRKVPSESGGFTEEKLPLLKNVPVNFQCSASFIFIFDLAPGDAVTLVFQERSDSDWRKSGKPGTPQDQRMHGLVSCVAVPGRFPDADVPADVGPQLGLRQGQRLYFGAGAVTAADSPAAVLLAKAVAIAEKVDAQLTTIAAAFDAHAHASFGAPPTAVPDQIPVSPSLSATAASNLKASP